MPERAQRIHPRRAATQALFRLADIRPDADAGASQNLVQIGAPKRTEPSLRDDLIGRLHELMAAGCGLANLETGEPLGPLAAYATTTTSAPACAGLLCVAVALALTAVAT